MGARRTVGEILELPGTISRWWYRTSGRPSGSEIATLFGAVPAVLIGVWLLPIGEGWAFSLAAESVFDPDTLPRAFTANLVHVDGQHLLDNVVNYLVAVFAIYPLVAIAGWGREFLASVAVYVLAGPIAIGWLTLTTLGAVTNQPSLGFSGFNTTLLGFLLVVLFVAAAEITDGTIRPWLAIAPFTIAIGTVLALPHGAYFPVAPLAGSGLVLLGVATIGGWYATADGVGVSTSDGVGVSDPEGVGVSAPDGRLALLVGGTVFGFGTIGALFVGGAGTNLWGHVGGYAIGFAVPYLLFVVPRTLRELR